MGVTESSATLLEGPWQHRFLAAGGTRFHVAQAGDDRGTPVLLVHGFPQFWWTWREFIPALDGAGYRPVAMDLRGCAASDKPPDGYDIPTLARDVLGVVGCLGNEPAIVVGQGLGGLVAWTAALMDPGAIRAVVCLAAPAPGPALRHPRKVLSPMGRQRLAWLRAMPSPERALAQRGLGGKILREWSARPWWNQRPDAVATYADALRVPFAADKAAAPLRWLGRSRRHRGMRRYARLMSGRLAVPLLHVVGDCDPLLASPRHPLDAKAAPDNYRFQVVADAGHFLTEEAPQEVAATLLAWLDDLPKP